MLYDINACPIHLRETGWRFYERACSRWELATLPGHTSGVSSVAFSPDGRTLASGSVDKSVWLWDAKTSQVRATLRGHTDRVCSVAFSPDGRTLATASWDTTARLWDVGAGQPGTTLQEHTDSVKDVAFSPDGQTLAGGSADMTLRLWDARTGQIRATLFGHTASVKDVAFSPDGKRVFGWDVTGKVLAWSTADGRPTDPDDPPQTSMVAVVTNPEGSLRAEVRSYGIVLYTIDAERRDLEEREALEPVNRLWWHQQQAEQAERDNNWFAAGFHLRHLLKLKPEDPVLLDRQKAVRAKLQPQPPMDKLP